MAIRIKFDPNYNAESPTIVLATRKGRKLGSIPAENINFKRCLNSYSEISFCVSKVTNGVEYKQWDKLKDFKLIWCREWDLWFEINVEIDESDSLIKNVTGKSLGEAELSQINLYNIEINTETDIQREDYTEPTVLYNNLNPSASLLNRITEKAPHYTIHHVDEGIKSIQRTFSFDNISIYEAMQNIAEEIECIFIINCKTNSDGFISREIDVYDLKSYCLDCGERDDYFSVCPKCSSQNVLRGYGQDTSISISTSNLADNITYSTNAGAVKNCFKLVAGDDLMTATITNCNPNGSSYLYYISDDVRADMSEELRNKIAEYDSKYENYYHGNYSFAPNSTTLTKYNALADKYLTYSNNKTISPHVFKKIESPIKSYDALMTAFYDTIDFNLVLESSLMPYNNMAETTAASEASKLKSYNLSPTSVMNIDSVTEATATSAVLAMAKVFVNSRYQVKVKECSFSGRVWTGSFTVTNYSDDSDTADSSTISITINGEYENFVKQKLNKVLSKASDGETDIVSLFGLSGSFVKELKKYSLARLLSFHDACQSCLDVMIEEGISSNENSTKYANLYLPYYNKFKAISNEIKTRESEIETIEEMQSLIRDERNKIQSNLNFETFLGEDLWLEFCSYRREDTYQNSNYISDGLDNTELFSNALEFINRAKKDIYKSAVLQHSITAKLKNLLVMKEFKPIVDYFEVGNWIRLIINNIIYRLRLLDYKISFNDLKNIEITFSDVTVNRDGMSDVESVLNQASAMATSYGQVAHQASQGNKGNEKLKNWVSKGLSLTNMKIVDSADNQNMTFDSHGLLCREYLPITDTYDDKQLKIINKGVYLTDDDWKTSKAGIGNFTFYNPATQKTEERYGVIADTLVGSLILSESVGVYNENNSITLDKKGLVITADGTETAFTIRKKKSDNSYDNLLWVDSDGVLNISNSVVIGGSGSSSGVKYATCSSSRSSNVKEISVSDLTELYDGLAINVCFTYGNNADYPKLKVNNLGSGDIMVEGKYLSKDSLYNWADGAVVQFVFTKGVTQNFWSMVIGGAANIFDENRTTINGGKIATSSITATQIASETITSSEIKSGAITSEKIAAGAITAEKVNVGWQSGNLAADWYNPDNLTFSDYFTITTDSGNNYYSTIKIKKAYSGTLRCTSKSFYLAAGDMLKFGGKIYNKTATLSGFYIEYSSTSNGNYAVIVASNSGTSGTTQKNETYTATASGWYHLTCAFDNAAVGTYHSGVYCFHSVKGNLIVNGQIESTDGSTYFDLDKGRLYSQTATHLTELTSGKLKLSAWNSDSGRWDNAAELRAVMDAGGVYGVFSWTKKGIRLIDNSSSDENIYATFGFNEINFTKQTSIHSNVYLPSENGIYGSAKSSLSRHLIGRINHKEQLLIGWSAPEILFTVSGDTKLKLSVDGLYLGGNPVETKSSEKYKTDILPYIGSALSLVKSSVIYSYKYKSDGENALTKYGLIIERECPQEVVDNSGDAISLYSMCSILWKSVQELSQKVAELEKNK